MSALGQKQTLDWRPLMSALPPKADIDQMQLDVRFAKSEHRATPIRSTGRRGRAAFGGVPVFVRRFAKCAGF
jgi:hypothetical protein